MHPLKLIVRLVLTSALLAGLMPARAQPAERPANDFSAAEQALFMDKHLGGLKPPLTLHYRYRKTGTLEAPFDDSVDVKLSPRPDHGCCAAKARFFSGARELHVPEVESAEGNPLIMYFLDRDIAEMERLTKGKSAYFRKRIRMAVYQGAQIRSVAMPYGKRQVEVSEITISPYLDDPNRPRFEKLALKRYVFLLSHDVPGGVYGIRTRIDADSPDSPPLMAEELMLDAPSTTPSKRQP